MAIVRIAKNVGLYQISLEGKEEEISDMIKQIDSLAGKIVNVPMDVGQAIPTSTIASKAGGQELPAVVGAKSAAEAVTKLFETEWGTIPRTIREIKEMLEANALFYPTTSLSGVLINLARQGKLRRWKSANGYSYVKGKAS